MTLHSFERRGRNEAHSIRRVKFGRETSSLFSTTFTKVGKIVGVGRHDRPYIYAFYYLVNTSPRSITVFLDIIISLATQLILYHHFTRGQVDARKSTYCRERSRRRKRCSAKKERQRVGKEREQEETQEERCYCDWERREKQRKGDEEEEEEKTEGKEKKQREEETGRRPRIRQGRGRGYRSAAQRVMKKDGRWKKRRKKGRKKRLDGTQR